MYREEIKVLDCTIRDGGLINNFQFSDELVEGVYKAACLSGVDIVELGKKLCESEEYTREKYGKWNFCDEDDLKKVHARYEHRAGLVQPSRTPGSAAERTVPIGARIVHVAPPMTCGTFIHMTSQGRRAAK